MAYAKSPVGGTVAPSKETPLKTDEIGGVVLVLTEGGAGM